jgi:hypothetical protein
MNTTTTHITPPPSPSTGNLCSAARTARRPRSESSTVDGLFGADLPLIGIVPFGLPSLLFLAGWVLLALCLVAPFVLLLTIALATAIVVGTSAAIVALPYLLVRSLNRYRVRRPSRRPLVHWVRWRRPTRHASPTRRRGASLVNPPAAPSTSN